jgi:hypothetical protein
LQQIAPLDEDLHRPRKERRKGARESVGSVKITDKAKTLDDTMSNDDHKLPSLSSDAQVQAFLEKTRATPRSAGGGRLIFALDATASRQPAWDQACQIQAEMFNATNGLGGLETQLCWYRGFGEFSAAPWIKNADALLRQMSRVYCLGGVTQIEKLLRHAIAETKTQKVDALVFVGDCMEENLDLLCDLAGQLGLLALPVFIFQEGREPVAEQAFAQIAKLSGGAHCRFDANSAQQLKDLLSAVAVYAAGGRKALENFSRRRGGELLRLTQQMKKR